jgi:hypothetical protein
MKIHKSQTGFSPVHVLLLLILVGIIGFTGWKVYDANKSASNTDSSAPAKANNVAVTPPTQATIPEGFVEYKNDELGFKFAYPKEWGEVKVEPGAETDHLVSGSEYQLSFSLNASVTAGLKSKDWKHDPNAGHGGIVRAAGYTDSTLAQLTQEGSMVAKHNTEDSFITSGSILGVGCLGVGNVLVHNLGNGTYPSIAFLYFDKKIEEDFDSPVCSKTGHDQNINPSHLKSLKKSTRQLRLQAKL